MLLVKFLMWPGGDALREHTLSIASLACIGVARQDDAALGIRRGERAYHVKLYKDVQFGGPDGTGALQSAPVWREGWVRGHIPGARGISDLVGGALKLLLGRRLSAYVEYGGALGPAEPEAEPVVTALLRATATRRDAAHMGLPLDLIDRVWLDAEAAWDSAGRPGLPRERTA